MSEEILTKIRRHLETLKLLGIQKVLDQELAHATEQAILPTELVERLLSIEATARIERSIERRIKESRLPERKHLTEAQIAWILWNLHERLNKLIWARYEKEFLDWAMDENYRKEMDRLMDEELDRLLESES